MVPEEISAWKPESAPHAMVMNRNGNNEPANTGPVPLAANDETAGASMMGRAIRIPTASRAIVPTFMNVDR